MSIDSHRRECRGHRVGRFRSIYRRKATRRCIRLGMVNKDAAEVGPNWWRKQTGIMKHNLGAVRTMATLAGLVLAGMATAGYGSDPHLFENRGNFLTPTWGRVECVAPGHVFDRQTGEIREVGWGGLCFPKWSADWTPKGFCWDCWYAARGCGGGYVVQIGRTWWRCIPRLSEVLFTFRRGGIIFDEHIAPPRAVLCYGVVIIWLNFTVNCNFKFADDYEWVNSIGFHFGYLLTSKYLVWCMHFVSSILFLEYLWFLF